MFLLINIWIWLPFEAAIPHCSETFISALIVIPKSFSFTVVPKTVSPILWFISKFPCPACRHLHFQKFKCCLSPSVLIFLNTFVSSANFSTLLVILSSKSLIYIKNNKGPNTDPCGTPLKTSSLISLYLLQHVVFCQSPIVLSSQLCHSRYHGL